MRFTEWFDMCRFSISPCTGFYGGATYLTFVVMQFLMSLVMLNEPLSSSGTSSLRVSAARAAWSFSKSMTLPVSVDNVRCFRSIWVSSSMLLNCSM